MHHAASACALALTGIEPRLEAPRDRSCSSDLYATARGSYSRDFPLERMARDVRMFTIGEGTAQVLRTLVASKILGWKLPQTRDGYAMFENQLNRDLGPRP